MLSIPHMIVVFIVVLVVFGPQKLPELARGLGKLMAEFRKASTDFKSAFENEMREMERQTIQTERKKAADAAAASSASAPSQPATLGTAPNTESPSLDAPSDTRTTEAPIISPSTDSVPRSFGPVDSQTPALDSVDAVHTPPETLTEPLQPGEPSPIPASHEPSHGAR